jgi:hypothetical protein
MSLAGFEPTIPVYKRAKTFHALDRAATLTGSLGPTNRTKLHKLNSLQDALQSVLRIELL